MLKNVRNETSLDNWIENMGYGDEGLVKIDGFDEAAIGVVERCAGSPILCYDESKIIRKLAEDMSGEEATEYFEYNIRGAWVGEQTPCFLVKRRRK